MIRLLFLLLFASPAFSQPTPIPNTLSSSRVMEYKPLMATNLFIQCQKGSVSFNLATGEATYIDCTPGEGARKLFEAFSSQIVQACKPKDSPTKQ